MAREKEKKYSVCKPVYDVPDFMFLYTLLCTTLCTNEFFSFPRGAQIPIFGKSLSQNIPRFVAAFFCFLYCKWNFHVCMFFNFQWQFVFNAVMKKDFFLSHFFQNDISCKAELFYKQEKRWSGEGKEAKSGNYYITKLNDGDILHTILCFRNFNLDEMVDENEGLMRLAPLQHR
jgi:hypothetical protein